jgi:hypothetical protein
MYLNSRISSRHAAHFGAGSRFGSRTSFSVGKSTGEEAPRGLLMIWGVRREYECLFGGMKHVLWDSRSLVP